MAATAVAEDLTVPAVADLQVEPHLYQNVHVSITDPTIEVVMEVMIVGVTMLDL